MRLFALTVLVAGLLPSQETETATFRSSTRLVLRTVKARDPSGRLLAGLTASDFTVTENGVPQRVVVCEFENISDSSERSRIVASEKLSNGPEPGSRQGRRMLVLFFDLGGIARQSLGRAFFRCSSCKDEAVLEADRKRRAGN